MRTWTLPLMLIACGGPSDAPDKDAADDTDDTTPATDDTDDTTPATDDTDDTTPATDDTDPPPQPYDYTGTWNAMSDAYGDVAVRGYPCPTRGDDTPSGLTALVWAAGEPVRVTLTGFQMGYTCVVAERATGRDLTCTPDSGVYVPRGNYDLFYDHPMTASLEDDGTGSFTRRVETRCEGECAGVDICAWYEEVFQLGR